MKRMKSATPNSKATVRLATAFAVLAAFLVMAGLAWGMWRATKPAPLNARRAAERRKALAKMRAEDAHALKNPGWIDQSKGIVRLPIAEAMKLYVKEWQRSPTATRSNLLAREQKAMKPPPKPVEKPNPYE